MKEAVQNNDIERAKNFLTEYLEKNNLRKTQERYKILEVIYQLNGHFDADTLHLELFKRGEKISRATVYNTLDLLGRIGLVIKHQFKENHALYEKAYGFYQHDHLICLKCGQIFEFCDPRISEIYDTIAKKFNFVVEKHSLIL